MDQRLGLIFLGQLIVYLSLMLYNEQVGQGFAFVFGVFILSVYLISLIVEWIQPSKVPKWYFRLMVLSLAAPILSLVFWKILF